MVRLVLQIKKLGDFWVEKGEVGHIRFEMYGYTEGIIQSGVSGSLRSVDNGPGSK